MYCSDVLSVAPTCICSSGSRWNTMIRWYVISRVSYAETWFISFRLRCSGRYVLRAGKASLNTNSLTAVWWGWYIYPLCYTIALCWGVFWYYICSSLWWSEMVGLGERLWDSVLRILCSNLVMSVLNCKKYFYYNVYYKIVNITDVSHLEGAWS